MVFFATSVIFFNAEISSFSITSSPRCATNRPPFSSVVSAIAIPVWLCCTFVFCISLQEVFDNASGYGEYEKYIILDPNTIYTGGIGIFEGDVYINCQGSVIDLEEGNGIWIYADENYLATLDIQYCNIINGAYYGLSYSGISSGTVTNCNFYNNNIGIHIYKGPIKTYVKFNFEVLCKLKKTAARKGRKNRAKK